MLQFSSIPIKDFGSGIDQLSKEPQIPEGFSEDLVNIDPLPEGSLKKRAGYQKVAGNLPLRVNKISHEDNKICFWLDNAGGRSRINLVNLRNSPIIVQGRLGNPDAVPAGDFVEGSDTVHYYAGFDADTRLPVALGLNEYIIPLTEHGIDSSFIWAGLAISTSTLNESNQQVFLSEFFVDDTSKQITVRFINGNPNFKFAFLYLSNRASAAGTIYTGPYVKKDGTPVAPANTIDTGTHIYTVTVGQHSLSNFNLLVRTMILDSGNWVEVWPDEVTILANGDVEVQLTNGLGIPVPGVISIQSVPLAQTYSGIMNPSNNFTIYVPTPVFNGSPFSFLSIYEVNTLTGDRYVVMPESVLSDATGHITAVKFLPAAIPNGKTYNVVWSYEFVSSNKLCVTDTWNVFSDYEDLDPQLTLWGLSHEEIYTGEAENSRAGWVTHLDQYRAEGQRRLIAGHGGNLFSEQSFDESSTAFRYGSLLPSLRGRNDGLYTISTAFIGLSTPASRTRGNIQFTGGDSGWGEIKTIQYVPSQGVRYVISTPGRVGLIPVTAISTDPGLEDYLEVKRSGWAGNSGLFRILSYDDSNPSELAILVDMPHRDSPDFDEQDSGALGGIFTDRITLSTPTNFMKGDIVLTEAFTKDSIHTVVTVSGFSAVIDGMNSSVTLPSGLLIGARRKSAVLPLRDSAGPSVVNLVRGDMIKYPGVERLLNILYINSNSSEVVSIDGDGSGANVTLTSTATFSVGQKVLFRNSSLFTGVFTIVGIQDAVTLVIDTDIIGLDFATLVGNTIEVDEDFVWEDLTQGGSVLFVNSRWIPLEIPQDNFSITPKTVFKHFPSKSYDSQDFLRSTISNDTLFLTNGSDQVVKFDGKNIYRAGLVRWQPECFLAIDNAPAIGRITIPVTETAVTKIGAQGTSFEVPVGKEALFPSGSFLFYRLGASSVRYTVTHTTFKPADTVAATQATGLVHVSASISPVPAAPPVDQGKILRSHVFGYYFRLNAIDENDNVVASAVTGSADFKIELVDNSGVHIKLIGMPAWDIYDYDRLEVEIYRTKANQLGEYFHVSTIPMKFDDGNGYIDYLDYSSDEDLTDYDDVITSYFGAEIGTQLSHPLRSKFVTSTSNRLILGNITADPAITVQYYDNGSGTGIPASQLANQIWTLRRDSANLTAITDNVNVQRFQFRTTGEVAISSITIPDTTKFIVNLPGPAPAVGSWVYLFRKLPTLLNQLRCAGWYQVQFSAGNAMHLLNVDTQAHTINDVDSMIVAADPRDIPVWLGTDYGFQMANGNRDVLESYESIAVRRLTCAVNSAQRQTLHQLHPEFKAWIIAEAGGEFGYGQLNLKQPRRDEDLFAIEVPTYSSAQHRIYVNDIQAATNSVHVAEEKRHASRVLISVPNYPEMFDNPLAILDTSSRSAVDVNPADGQEITGIIPFFGESAFGASQKSGILVVFKTDSIYLVDISAKSSGAESYIQRISSQGLGCTAPYSITTTRNGIMFANASGMYKLKQDLSIQYLGRKMERMWRETIVNRDALNLFHGHNNLLSNQYLLSLSSDESLKPDQAFVYNHSREYLADGYRDGGWSRYTDYPAIGWANTGTGSAFASTTGQVMSIRNTGTSTDYRDNAAAISSTIKLRAMDFGSNQDRKVIGGVTLQFKSTVDSSGTVVSSAADLSDYFNPLDLFRISSARTKNTNLSDTEKYTARPIKFTLNQRKLQYVQILIENNEKDQAVELISASFSVAGIKDNGVLEATSTTTSSK